MTPEEMREAVAALEHEQWSHWTRHMLDNLTDENIQRWEHQVSAPYAELSEQEKDADRKWADIVIATALRAAAKQPKGWRVKDLEWVKDMPNYWSASLPNLLGQYVIERRIGVFMAWGPGAVEGEEPFAQNRDIEPVKAAAQAHHARRISEAIEPAPISVEEAARVLQGITPAALMLAMERAMADLGIANPRDRKQIHRDVFLGTLTAIAGGEE